MSISTSHAQLSLAPCPRTLLVQGLVKELSVTILIDSGSSHNIMQPRIPEFLHFPIEALTPFSVIVINGESIQCSGSCLDVPVTLAGETFSIPFYVLPIHGADLVLGVQWLQTLGAFLSDYNIPSIQFSYNGKPITISGPSSHFPAPATFSQFCRFIFTDSVASCHAISVNCVEDKPSVQGNSTELVEANKLQPDIAQLIHQHASVFSIPKGLPPHRLQDHHIHLNPESQLVNVRPYRYPHFQKEVITKMIQDMLQEGIIKPSTSPFSSPVLLVWKKDDTWQFCVDYKALN